MTFTERVSEHMATLAVTWPASYNSEQNTAFVNVSLYRRILVVILAGDIGTSLDADVEIATDGSATSLFTLKSITQLTQAGGDDNSEVRIEIRAEELQNPSGASASDYDYLRVETTPSGSCIYSVHVYGLEPRYAPVPITNIDEVVD